jgi:hypothetical protein
MVARRRFEGNICHTLRPSAGENETPSGARRGMANGRRPLTLISLKDFLEVSNIDQRAMMPSRHTAAITAPFRHSSVTERSEALPLDLARGIYARSTNAHFIASRGGAASLSQMPVAHGGSAYYLGTFRVRALDPTVHRVQAYPRGAGKRRPDEIRCYRLVAQRPESTTHARRQAPKVS